MSTSYFEITDIVEYCLSNSHVSGIQRVQVQILSELAAAKGGDAVRCIYRNPMTEEVMEFAAGDAFHADFDTLQFVRDLGFGAKGIFPPKHEVKRYLQKYGHRKVLRSLKKAQIYALAAVYRPKLRAMGFSTTAKGAAGPGIKTTRLGTLQPRDVLIFLGANWANPSVLELGQRHLRSGGQVLQMIYDLIPVYGQEYCKAQLISSFKEFIDKTASYASRFMAISEWSKKDLLCYHAEQQYQREVDVLPLAHEFAGYPRNASGVQPQDASLWELAATKFFLNVGTIEIRKNGVALLKIWQKLVAKLGDACPTLVFAGKYGWKITPFLDILSGDEALAKKVKVLSTPSDRDLAYLYQHCHAALYPSYYEGWGLPVGEAAWFGKFTLCSTATSLPEVCGDLLDYERPDDIDGWVAAILKLLDDPDYLRLKEQRIREAKLRTWGDVAQAMQSLIEASRP